MICYKPLAIKTPEAKDRVDQQYKRQEPFDQFHCLRESQVSNFDFSREFPVSRMRRMRRDSFSRRLMRETCLSADDLIFPVFIVEGSNEKQAIESMPGIFRLSVDNLLKEAAELVALTIPAIALFPSLDDSAKSLDGREAYNPEGLVQRAVKALKEGQIEIKNDKDGNVSASIGKKSFDDKKIIDNFSALIQTIQKVKPNGVKEDFILSSFITSTMGISHKIKVKA